MNVFVTVESLAREWDELAEETEAVPWLRRGWIEAWLSAFGQGSLEIFALSRGDRLVALLPLERQHGTLRSPSNVHTPSFGVLAVDDEARRELLQAVFSQRAPHISMAFVLGDSADIRACELAALGTGRRLMLRTLERSPYLPIQGAWEAYEHTLDKALVTDLRRRWRGLEKRGHVSVHVADGAKHLEELLHDGLCVEAAGWKGERGTAIVSRDDTRRFYERAARSAARQGWLRLAFLRLNGRPIAFDLCFEHEGVHYLLKTGFDPAFRPFGPGKLLRREMLKRAFSLGLESYEFLGTDEQWKLEWTQVCRERDRVQAFSGSFAGYLHWSAFAYGRPVGKQALSLVRR